MKNCFLYPGQGAQYPGMGRDLWDYSDKIKKLFKTASESSGMDLEKLLFHGTEEDLRQTNKTQVAITLVNIASALILREKGIESELCAGFSLGEISALWDAGVIDTDTVFSLVRERGLIMEKISRSLDSPDGAPGMAAVVGLDFEAVAGVIKNENLDEVFIANYNSPSQIVISGTHNGLAKSEELLKIAGARRYIRLKVSGPFHCPLMKEAETEYAEALEKYTFNDPVKKVFSNVTGKAVVSGTEAKQLCSKQLTSAVLWVSEERALLGEGIEKCFEAGPGSVLGGLWKAVGEAVPCLPAGKIDEILKF
jgi:[acyl-carrier-protein] S-malonyltransferase